MPKLLLIAAVIAVVLYIFRRMKVAKDSGGGSAGSAGQNAARNGKPVEDMVQCRSCGAYFPANSTCSCSRG